MNFRAERIAKFVGSNYGTFSSNQFKSAIDESYDREGNLTEEGRVKIKDMFLIIMQKEIAKTYKIPNNVGSG